MKAPLKAQERAFESAGTLLFIVKRERVGMSWPEIEAAGRKEFGKFPSRNTVKGWKRKTEGVDPANWARALAPGWTGSGSSDPVSPEAWNLFVDYMKMSGKNRQGPNLKSIYHVVAGEAGRSGWDWPKLHTVRRLWNAGDPATRLFAQLGAEECEDRLRQSQLQHTSGPASMARVHSDAREFKVRVRWADGTVGCPWVVAITDVVSRKIVGWSIGRSENADVTEAVVRDMAERYGRPISLTFDNGRAFNSKRIAGGQRPFFRTGQTSDGDWDVPGVLQILGIELCNTGVAAKRSMLQENTWSHLARTVDSHPAFYGAQRPGPNDPEIASPQAVPEEDFAAILAQEIDRLNAEARNRVHGLKKGESRDMAFERLRAESARRNVTPLMRRQLSMVWKRRTVGRDGRIRFGRGLFGDATTQMTMMQHAGKMVLIGFDPRDFDAGAMVCHWADIRNRGRLILEHLPAFEATAHGSEEGRRAALKERRRVRDLAREVAVADPGGKAAALHGEVRTYRRAEPPESAVKVAEFPSGAGLLTRPQAPDPDTVSREVLEEKLRNFDRSTDRFAASKV